MTRTKVAKVIGTTALAITLVLGGATMVGVQKNLKVSNQTQISSIAQQLNADQTVMTNNKANRVYRLDHNNGEPIYVSVDANFTEAEQANIAWSLDYVFGLVGDINPNYHYEIVSEDQRINESRLGKTTIKYQEDNSNFSTSLGISNESYGSCRREFDNLSKLVNNPTYDNFIITYNREKNLSSSENMQKYTFLHELLHAFGFEDVYNATAMNSYINKFCGDTVMNDHIGSNTNMLTPSDYRNIISAYAPRMNDDELKEFINIYKQKTQEYDESYYKSYASICENKLNIISNLDTSKNYTAGFTKTLTTENGNQITEYITIKIKDGKYSLSIYDTNGVLLDNAKGDIMDCDNLFILSDVQLKKGLRPLTDLNNNINSYINDFVFMKDSKSNQFIFYNLSSNDAMRPQKVIESENTQEYAPEMQ